jgi:hypothetical protein
VVEEELPGEGGRKLQGRGEAERHGSGANRRDVKLLLLGLP